MREFISPLDPWVSWRLSGRFRRQTCARCEHIAGGCSCCSCCGILCHSRRRCEGTHPYASACESLIGFCEWTWKTINYWVHWVEKHFRNLKNKIKWITRRCNADTGAVSCSGGSSDAGWVNFYCSWTSGKRDRRIANCCPDLFHESSCDTWDCDWWQRRSHRRHIWILWVHCGVWRGSPTTGSSSSSSRKDGKQNHLHLREPCYCALIARPVS